MLNAHICSFESAVIQKALRAAESDSAVCLTSKLDDFIQANFSSHVEKNAVYLTNNPKNIHCLGMGAVTLGCDDVIFFILSFFHEILQLATPLGLFMGFGGYLGKKYADGNESAVSKSLSSQDFLVIFEEMRDRAIRQKKATCRCHDFPFWESRGITVKWKYATNSVGESLSIWFVNCLGLNGKESSLANANINIYIYGLYPFQLRRRLRDKWRPSSHTDSVVPTGRHGTIICPDPAQLDLGLQAGRAASARTGYLVRLAPTGPKGNHFSVQRFARRIKWPIQGNENRNLFVKRIRRNPLRSQTPTHSIALFGVSPAKETY